MSWLDQSQMGCAGSGARDCAEQSSGDVVMFAWMNRGHWKKTAELGRAVTSAAHAQQAVVQGEESGHVQTVHEMRIDCDNGVVLLKITPRA